MKISNFKINMYTYIYTYTIFNIFQLYEKILNYNYFEENQVLH